MAGEWDVTLGMDFMRMGASPNVEDAAAASPAACFYSLPPAADTLGGIHGFSGRNLFPRAAATAGNAPFFESTDQTSAADKPFSRETNSSSDLQCNRSSFDFDIPCEEEAELEWLSQFVEDSFSDVPFQYAGATAAPSGGSLQLRSDECTNGRAARSKRSRCSNPSTVWSTLAPPPPAQLSPSSSSSSSDLPPSLASPMGSARSSDHSRGKKGGGELVVEGGVRRCTHCASERTPQWRTGPLGPKTLCNACGVRYKSGRLLPEYRPAASPTFVLTQHSNSHRKVMELRRQKEVVVFLGRDNHATGAGAEQLLLDDKFVC